jgi:RimJ/RimL family protein N-acetyltransferase
MSLAPVPTPRPKTEVIERLVERVVEFTEDDLHALCEATDAAIIDGGGFGWVNPPGRRALETYFRGVLLVPERELFVARLNGTIVGSAHLVRPPRNNEAQAFAAHLMHSYIAPYARTHGLARILVQAVEERARDLGYQVLNLDVRETQEAAIRLYERLGYARWGIHPEYALVRGKVIRGLYYYKRLRPRKPQSAADAPNGVDPADFDDMAGGDE